MGMEHVIDAHVYLKDIGQIDRINAGGSISTELVFEALDEDLGASHT